MERPVSRTGSPQDAWLQITSHCAYVLTGCRSSLSVLPGYRSSHTVRVAWLQIESHCVYSHYIAWLQTKSHCVYSYYIAWLQIKSHCVYSYYIVWLQIKSHCVFSHYIDWLQIKSHCVYSHYIVWLQIKSHCVLTIHCLVTDQRAGGGVPQLQVPPLLRPGCGSPQRRPQPRIHPEVQRHGGPGHRRAQPHPLSVL